MSKESTRGADRLAWAGGLEPAAVWREFAALATIARRSKHEGLVRAHVLERLKALGSPRDDGPGGQRGRPGARAPRARSP